MLPVSLASVGAIATIAIFVLFLGGEDAETRIPHVEPGVGANVRIQLDVQKVSIAAVVLKWTSPTAADVRSYSVERDGVVVGQLPVESRRFVDHDVSPGTRYRYQVIAVVEQSELTSRPVSAKTPVPPLDRARIDGSYRIVYTVEGSNLSNAHPGDPIGTYTWEFTPDCQERPCGGSWTILLKGGDAIGTLAYGASAYSGKMSGVSLGFCGDISNTSDSATLTMRATKAKVIGGMWIATAVEGSFREYFPAGNGCVAGFLRADVTGTLRR